MSRDPFPLLNQVLKVIPSRDVLPDDLDTPAGYAYGVLPDRLEGDQISLTVHWGGGPNPAGEELPPGSWRERFTVSLGRVKSVLRSWHAYHLSKGWQAIAYCVAIGPRFGHLVKLRGWRRNAGQWSSINAETFACVFVLGSGQYPGRAAWRSLGLLWLAMGGPTVKGHRDWNSDPRTQSPTSCPGDEITLSLRAGKYIEALGVLRCGTVWRPVGKAVKAATAVLARLGYLERRQRLYRRHVARAVERFQADHGLTVDGAVGPRTWEALAEAYGGQG